MIIRKNGLRVVAAGAALALAAFVPGAANADTVFPVQGGDLTQTLSDGTVVTIKLTGQWANINPSLGSTPLHRNVWTGGTAQVDIKGEAETRKITAGYVIGCQFSFGGTAGADAGGSLNPPSASTSNTQGPTANFTIGPGQSVSVPVLDREYADDYGNESHNPENKFGSNHGSVTWDGVQLQVTGCAGYAEARPFATVKVETAHVVNTVTVWGQPFSMG
jgi:hypothetical protein